MFSENLLIGKNLLQNGEMLKKCPLQAIAYKIRRPVIPQLNIKGVTANQMNVLYYLSLKLKALVIVQQETYCINLKKLVLSDFQLARSSLCRKYGFATFVHERLKYTIQGWIPQDVSRDTFSKSRLGLGLRPLCLESRSRHHSDVGKAQSCCKLFFIKIDYLFAFLAIQNNNTLWLPLIEGKG